jgi:hypothetical protein
VISVFEKIQKVRTLPANKLSVRERYTVNVSARRVDEAVQSGNVVPIPAKLIPLLDQLYVHHFPEG